MTGEAESRRGPPGLLRQDVGEARRLLVAGDLDGAGRIHLALAQAYPEERAVIRLGLDLYWQRKDTHATLSLALTALAQFADDAGFLATACQALRKLGRVDEMHALLAGRPEEVTQSPQVAMQRGYAARDAGEREQALGYFRTAGELPRARVEVLRELMAVNRLDEAESVFAEAVAQLPESRGLLRAGVDLAERRRQPVVVAGRAAHALSLFPEENAFLAALVRARLDRHEYGEARSLLEAVPPSRLNGDRHLLAAAAQLARATGDTSGALLLVEKALVLAPADLVLAVQRAWLLRSLGQLDGAQQACRTVLLADHARVPAWICLVETVKETGNREASLAVLEEARAACPDEIWFDIRRAEELRELDRSAEALDLTTSLLADDAPEELCLVHAELLADQVSVLAALAFFQTHIRPRFETARVWAREANLLSRFGFAARAEGLCREGLARFPGDPELESVLVRGLIAGGQIEAALAVADTMATLNPVDTRRRDRLRLLALEWSAQGEAALRSLEAEKTYDPEAVALLARFYLRQGERARLAALLAAHAPAGASRQARAGMRTSIPGHILNDSLCQRPLHPEETAGDLAAKRALARAFPEDTAAAIAYLSGLPPGSAGGAAGPIPRRALIYWSSDRPPPDIADIIEGNRKALAGFDFAVMDRQSAFEFVEHVRGRESAHLLFRCTSEAQVSDVLRLVWLAEGGGVYIDADDRVTGDIGPLLDGADLLLYREDLGSIGNNFLAATPCHPLIVAALEAALAHLHRADPELVWLSTGPGLLTRIVAGALAESGAEAWPTNFRVLSHVELRRTIAIHCHAAYKSAGHWTRSAFGRAVPAAAATSAPRGEDTEGGGTITACLQRVGDMVAASRYLEIGVGDGARFNALRFSVRDGVAPDPDVVPVIRPNEAVRLFQTPADQFWRSGEGGIYDLVCLDASRRFDDACRDFLASLRHACAGTIWLVTGTIPSDAISALPDEEQARAERARLGLPPGPWQGDVFRLVPFVAHFMPSLDFGTITGSGEAHTLFWQAGAAVAAPGRGGLDTLIRFGYPNIAERLADFRPGSESDVLERLAASLRR